MSLARLLFGFQGRIGRLTFWLASTVGTIVFFIAIGFINNAQTL